MLIAQIILGTFVYTVNIHTGYSMLSYNHSKGTKAPTKMYREEVETHGLYN